MSRYEILLKNSVKASDLCTTIYDALKQELSTNGDTVKAKRLRFLHFRVDVLAQKKHLAFREFNRRSGSTHASKTYFDADNKPYYDEIPIGQAILITEARLARSIKCLREYIDSQVSLNLKTVDAQIRVKRSEKCFSSDFILMSEIRLVLTE